MSDISLPAVHSVSLGQIDKALDALGLQNVIVDGVFIDAQRGTLEVNAIAFGDDDELVPYTFDVRSAEAPTLRGVA